MNYRNINTLIKPVLVLSQHMLMAAKGNLDCKVESDREDEIGQLEFSFNKMIDDLMAFAVLILKSCSVHFCFKSSGAHLKQQIHIPLRTFLAA